MSYRTRQGPRSSPWAASQRTRPVLLVMLLLVAVLSTSCNLFKREDPNLPVPLRELIPEEWWLLPKGRGELGVQQVNIDGDEDQEWLIFFYYDNVYVEEEEQGAHGPVGGVIYDAQQDTTPYDPQVVIPFPYQPSAFLVPYRLLPDWRAGKGQGYLAESNVTWEQTGPDPAEEKYDELVVFGQGPGGVTRLSIFWWQGPQVGYGVNHFVGTQLVELKERGPGGTVLQVVTKDRLNDRSNLCKQVVHQRRGDSHIFDAGPPTIVFCQGTPTDPTHPAYPEAVVLAWLDKRSDKLVVPVRLEMVKQAVPKPERVLSLTYNGTATTMGVGNLADSLEVVYTTLETDKGNQVYWFHLVEQRPATVGETSKFLIYDAGMLPG